MSATNPKFVQWKTAPRRQDAHRIPPHRVERIDRPSSREELQALTRRYDELTSIAAQLVEECARLRAENADLRASAEIWIRMYEHQLERTRSLEEQLLGGPRRG